MAKNALFEIGVEELPARFVDDAELQLKEKTESWLQELRITFESVVSYSTPRRLAVLIKGIAEEQTTIEEEVKGPAEKIAKAADGNWSKAAIGFTKGQGKTVDDIYSKEINGTNYIFVEKHIEGKQTITLLPEFHKIVESITFGKNMRWGTQSMRYARPIRWLVALLGGTVIPFEVAGVKSGKTTYGHRFLGDKIDLNNPLNYEDTLLDQFVIVNPKRREDLILEGIHTLEKSHSIQIPVDKQLLDEVRNLVEYPQAFLGAYEKQFLKLPEEVLITSMKEHQRYFPVKSNTGELLPYFVGIRNGNDDALNTVIKGNEKVLRARLSDAEFFYNEDLKHSIDFYNEKLNRVVFQEKLGTITDKVKRVVVIANHISDLLHIEEKENILRAASICKFDLSTNMVNEFTELQGVIGEKYAQYFGETRTVAQAVREHYLPKQANGELPNTIEGSIISIADKLDTVAGCIGVGLIPSGSQDPYGLRRQATGILRIIEANKWNIPMETLINLALEVMEQSHIQILDKDKAFSNLHDFLTNRAAYLFKEESIEQDIIQAILHKEIGVYPYALAKAHNLSNKRLDASFKTIQEALVRVLNLAQKANSNHIDTNLFDTESEKALYKEFCSIEQSYQQSERDAERDLLLLGQLAEPIHNFFDHNMVMDDNERIRNNRLALLASIASLIQKYADLTKVEWKQSF
ncbi:MAG: glycine--tRNA ligase subunit beta [Bacillota bacterium]|uniref:glycine--tRNA ligase subunit beta n=1 Tax=Virgibacillus salarius TaxID=447199 RepID=UPI00249029C5|nr:glycine--tRNA ligase subunit beta [Virgibacillus salarius]WBX79112.1 glycine--tRNA ligase subunit beta [Virgibacillus salarius]